MIVHTKYYGDLEYTKEDLFFFPDGLFGFTELKYYLPLCMNEEDDAFLLLQSTEEPEIAFIVINPVFLCPDYAPNLTSQELSYLEVADCEELSYFSICVLKTPYTESTVNLKCPIAINPTTHKGLQVIMENCPYGYRHKLSSFASMEQG